MFDLFFGKYFFSNINETENMYTRHLIYHHTIKPNFNSKILKKFKELQLPVEFKKRQSSFVIKNNFKHNFIKENVKQVLEKIL